MLKIAVCDDEYVYLNKINTLIETYFEQLNVEIKYSAFSVGEKLLHSVRAEEYDVIFLDIGLKTSNGLSIAKEIRANNFKGIIVFVTTHSEFSPEGYKVDAFRYILKKNLENELKECLDSLLDRLNLIRLRIDKLDLSVKDIVYVESNNHQLIFHLADGKVETCWKKLSDVEAAVNSEQLVRVHQSYIINMQYFEEIFKYKIVLKGGATIPIPRAKYNKIKNKIAIRSSLWE